MMIIIFKILLILSFVLLQDDDFLDLSQPQVRRERKSGGRIIDSDFSMAGDSRRKPNALKITLIDIDKKSYSLGDQAIFNIKLENIGQTAIILPWSADYDRVKPDDEKRPPDYLSAIINLAVEDKSQGTLFFGGESVYGSDLLPGSLKQLDPGRSVRIKIRTQLRPNSSEEIGLLAKKLPFKLNVHARFAFLEGAQYKAFSSENAIEIELRRRPD
jgi:hypothetical protein